MHKGMVKRNRNLRQKNEVTTREIKRRKKERNNVI